MIKNNILINTETRNIVKRDYDFLGVEGENGIEQLVFLLTDFFDGTAIVEYQKGNEIKGFITLPPPTDNMYILDIKKEILKDTKKIFLQLHITSANVEVFKSRIFKMDIYRKIGATNEIPEEYDEWIDVANGKIAEMNNLERSIENAETERERKTDEAIGNIRDMTSECEEIKTNCENLRDETEAIKNTAKDFVSAVTFAKPVINPFDGHLYFKGKRSLGTMGFKINWESNKFPKGHLIHKY